MAITVKHFSTPQDYSAIFANMREFTLQRTINTPDELWFLEHQGVFTQGQAGKPEHILNPHDIPIIQSDRGGQVTYHGPGQLMGYLLLDLKRYGLNIRQYVCFLETTIIQFLAEFGISAKCVSGAPGVYVHRMGDDHKICSIGIRVRKGLTYHGISLNVCMDMSPFSYINPCGFKNLTMCQITDFCQYMGDNKITVPYIAAKLANAWQTQLLQLHNNLQLTENYS